MAAAAWLLARSRRLGPPEDEARALPPPRWAYVDAVAGTLARTRRPHEATEPVRQRARQLIARRTGLPPDAAPDDLYRAALRLGLPRTRRPPPSAPPARRTRPACWPPAGRSPASPEENDDSALGRAAPTRREETHDHGFAERGEGAALASLRDRVAAEVGRVVVGQDEVVDLLLAATWWAGTCCWRAYRGGQDPLGPGVVGGPRPRLPPGAVHPRHAPVRPVGHGHPAFDPASPQGAGGRQDLAFRPGPVFTNVLLADEINRTPPKTQAALLEAMQEAQVSVDGVSHPLPQPFLVVATQNPIEYEGTYPLPEAQLDRFLLKVDVGYPSVADEEAILRLAHRGVTPVTLDEVQVAATASDLAAAQAEVDATTVADEVVAYVVAVVRRTRELPSVSLGASPRAAVHLLAASRAAARLRGRAFVTPDDVAAMAPPVLRHRLVLRPEAELERYRPDDAVAAALASVPVPR